MKFGCHINQSALKLNMMLAIIFIENKWKSKIFVHFRFEAIRFNSFNIFGIRIFLVFENQFKHFKIYQLILLSASKLCHTSHMHISIVVAPLCSCLIHLMLFIWNVHVHRNGKCQRTAYFHLVWRHFNRNCANELFYKACGTNANHFRI